MDTCLLSAWQRGLQGQTGGSLKQFRDFDTITPTGSHTLCFLHSGHCSICREGPSAEQIFSDSCYSNATSTTRDAFASVPHLIPAAYCWSQALGRDLLILLPLPVFNRLLSTWVVFCVFDAPHRDIQPVGSSELQVP